MRDSKCGGEEGEERSCEKKLGVMHCEGEQDSKRRKITSRGNG